MKKGKKILLNIINYIRHRISTSTEIKEKKVTNESRSQTAKTVKEEVQICRGVQNQEGGYIRIQILSSRIFPS